MIQRMYVSDGHYNGVLVGGYYNLVITIHAC